MQDYAYYNGVFCPYDAMTIPLSDRAIFFGESVYDVMLGRNGCTYQFDKHIKRLRSNCERLRISPNISDNEIEDRIRETIAYSEFEEYTVYIQISGYGRRRAHLTSDDETNILITVTEYHSPDQPEIIRAVTLPDDRYDYCDVKTTNLLPNILSMKHARDRNAEVAIFKNGKGELFECSHSNIFALQGKTLITAPPSNRILPGITRDNLLSAAKNIGLQCKEEYISNEKLSKFDAILISSTTHFIRICTEIDGIARECSHNEYALALFNSLRNDYVTATDVVMPF